MFEFGLTIGLLHLRSIKKYATKDGNVSTRVNSLDDTFDLIVPICKKIGVTRLSDITYMDRLCIPNYSAILPGTEDNNMGIQWERAQQNPMLKNNSALMEAIERYCSLSKNCIFQVFLSKENISVLSKII